MLREILEQEITPELVPAREGERPQSTEDTIGPYALQDFTLFHVLRYGFPPSKIAFLARHAWPDADAGEWPPGFPEDAPRRLRPGDDPALAGGLRPAVLRFSQFKRSALPNGPKVAAGGSLSPRGDWRAPSDGNAPGLARRAAPQRPGGLTPLSDQGRAREHRTTARPPGSEMLLAAGCAVDVRRRTHGDPTAATTCTAHDARLVLDGLEAAYVRRADQSLLRSKDLPAAAERWCINLVEQPDGTGIKHVVGSSNDMHMFKDNSLRPGDVVRGARARPEVLAVGRRRCTGCCGPAACWSICVPGLRQAPRRTSGSSRRRFRVHYRVRLLPLQPAGGAARCSSRASTGVKVVARARPAADHRRTASSRSNRRQLATLAGWLRRSRVDAASMGRELAGFRAGARGKAFTSQRHAAGQTDLRSDAGHRRREREAPHGQAGRLRAPGTRGARRPVRAAVVHRRARLPEVGGGRAGRARGRLRRGHRLRRLRDRGLRPGLRGRHAGQAGPVDLPDPAVARRGPVARRGCSATS